ncbi:MAG: hypothetical protein OEW99_00960 [Gammaproteobacteria bacterium]|nr:hypothetical protein [Gammaproteobacteria bacterium]
MLIDIKYPDYEATINLDMDDSKEQVEFLYKTLVADDNHISDLFPESHTDAVFLMELYLKFFNEGLNIPDCINNYIARSFFSVVTSEKKDKTAVYQAFEFAQPRKRPKINYKRDMEITGEIIYMQAGATLIEACLLLSDKYHLSESSIEKIYMKNKNNIEEYERLSLFN